jgi:Flp pilus assembly protein TadG
MRKESGIFKRNRRGDRGQGMLEFALVLPLLLLVLMAIIDFGWILLVYSNIFNATREGVRYGVTRPRDYYGIDSSARTKISVVPPDDVEIYVWYDHGPNTPSTDVFTDTNQVQVGDRVIVDAQYSVTPITPLLQPIIGDLQLQAQGARTIQTLGDAVSPPPPGPGGGGGGGGGGGDPPTATPTPVPSPTPEPSVTITSTVEPTLTPTPYFYEPIVIHDPVYDGSTVVTGTAEPGQTVRIRDLMDSAFPGANDTTIVQADGTFEFTGLPPLLAGHVIEVSGYEASDLATVQGELDPIQVNAPVCHADTVVDGTAQVGRAVRLHVMETGYQVSMEVGEDGIFSFDMLTNLPLQRGQHVEVTGYGRTSGILTVDGCEYPDPYIVISPQCGGPSTTQVEVQGFNWYYHNANDDTINVTWPDGSSVTVNVTNMITSWQTTLSGFTVDPEVEFHLVTAESQKASASTFFKNPCPIPNVVITHFDMVTTTTPISTYQPLTFTVQVENNGAIAVNSLFWVDLYTGEPVSNTTGAAWAAVSSLNSGDSKVVTLTHSFEVTGTYQLWALADSQDQVIEAEEGDNTAGPVEVVVSEEGIPPTSSNPGTGVIEGETWISLTGVPVPQGRVEVRVYDENDDLVAMTFSDEGADYTVSGLGSGTYTVIAETWVDSTRYVAIRSDIEVVDGETTTVVLVMYES